MTLAVFLTFFSPLYFEFDGKLITGWAKTTIIGDTTTGKSETVKQAIRLLQSGQMIAGETASVAGLGATTTQASNNQWFVEWGPLVLQDRKLLAIDGAHKLNRNTWAELAESEREGKIRITKAAKGEAYAQTRQIKIMNPLGEDLRTTRPMASFFYPCQAIVNNFQIQNIARQDLVAFVIDNVRAEDRNKNVEIKPDEKIFFLADLLKLVWKQDYDIVFESDAISLILEKATELENKFKFDEIPLITNDEKYKIAKLSASIAALTGSFNQDFTKLMVKKGHVDYVADLIRTEYHDSGLDILSAKKLFDDIDAELIEEIYTKIKDRLKDRDPQPDSRFCKELLLWIAQQSSFTRDQLASEFNMARDNELKPLIALLANEEIIARSKMFRPTQKGIEIGKFLNKKQTTITES